MAHDGVLASYAHSSQDLPGFPSYTQCHFYIIPFGHRNLYCCSFSLIHHFSKFPVKELRFGDFCEHFCQLLLCELKCADGFVKLLSLQRIPSSSIVTVHSSTNGTPRNAIPGSVQAV